MRFLRTFRFDASDEHVFERAAAPGEPAVPGGFVFSRDDPQALAGKRRQAFANGFLGLESFGFSTLAVIVDIDRAERARVVARLADHLLAHFGAPDIDAARAAAESEGTFAESLCEHPVNTILCVERRILNGEIREAFRTVARPQSSAHARIWDIVEGEDD